MTISAPPPSPTLDCIQRALSQFIQYYLGRELGQGVALKTPSSDRTTPAPPEIIPVVIEFAMIYFKYKYTSKFDSITPKLTPIGHA